jgi:Relaxase/Mobilisation nuclease domain.
MIGNITLGKVFSGCIGYCMEDKIELTEEEKIELSIKENLQHKDRAEVLFYNNCFGTVKELTKQFLEVRNLSSRTEKPVMHISLRLAPGETLSKGQLTEIAQACAEEFKFDKNQYVCVLHKDTREPHIHIVANRVGYDGRAVNLSNNYRKMANFCRSMEQKYGLQQVLNPRKFLSKEQRLLPRHDARKERLQKDIRNTLQRVTTYDQFETEMKSLGYQVLKGRGISFIDDRKVKIKGSEVGFSLSKIDQILSLRQKIEMAPQEVKSKAEMLRNYQPGRGLSLSQKLLEKTFISAQLEHFEKTAYHKMQKELANLLFGPGKSHESFDQSVSSELLREAKKKKKKHRQLER